MRTIALAAFVLGIGLAGVAQARYWEEDCFNVMTKKASLRKYDYKYMWGSSDTISKGKDGSSHVTSQDSTQSTTAGVDPGVTTGRWNSYSMFTSSKKPCSFSQNWEDRERFVADNADDIKSDVARGDGPHLRTFAQLTGCGDSVMPRLFRAMRTQFDAIDSAGAGVGELSGTMDQVIRADPKLKAGCAGV